MTAASAMTGVPSAPKATGAVLAISDRPEAASGEKPRPISIAAGDRDGRAEAGRALEEGAEGEGDEEQLQAPVARRCPAMLSRRTSNCPVASVSW